MPLFISCVVLLTVLCILCVVESAQHATYPGESVSSKTITKNDSKTNIHLSPGNIFRSLLITGDNNTDGHGSSINNDELSHRSFLINRAYHWAGTDSGRPKEFLVGAQSNMIQTWYQPQGTPMREMTPTYDSENDDDQPIYIYHITACSKTSRNKRHGLSRAEQRILDWHNEIMSKKQEILNDHLQWPTHEGEDLLYIPYEIHELEHEVQRLLEHYLGLFHQNTCLRWIKRTKEHDYVVVKGMWNEKGEMFDRCYSSSVGRKGGVQYVYLTTRCLGLTPGFLPALYNIPHELMHVLGFIHEQSRLDRDCYIALTEHGERDAYSNRHFTQVPTDMKFPYDINSVMQYRLPDSFISLQGDQIGPIEEVPSWQDWSKINYLYCGGEHICQTDTALCRRHKAILRRCISGGRMQQPSDPDVLDFLNEE